ncbi:MAG: hypothetical protein HRU35_00440 [Rickettsiaceae bacterium]|nr:hypothetical protein [Rickettsiaceae bacterium]
MSKTGANTPNMIRNDENTLNIIAVRDAVKDTTQDNGTNEIISTVQQTEPQNMSNYLEFFLHIHDVTYIKNCFEFNNNGINFFIKGLTKGDFAELL